MSRTYAVNTADRSFADGNARAVASVAAAWKRMGLVPCAYAIFDKDGMVTVRRVDVSTVRETARALRSVE